ncbi:hypothetical protein [Hanstruepera ponticola]|uniref:hypothetical protein n=1 Tax=Hanstruepera ponticola TaxID=2042995 RepID=UPI0017858EF3|nr:hypothetical protein [Hanstruepera ponticola]
MIKFFRKIRQNLLSEGKTGKYLKYAIGEIVLVVIGILIALQLNNANEDWKKEKLRQELLIELRSSIMSDTIVLKNERKDLKSAYTNANLLINIINDDLPYTESLDSSLALIELAKIKRADYKIFDRLLNIGIDIIDDKDLINEIVHYYEDSKNLEDIGHEETKLLKEKIYPNYFDRYRYGRKAKPNDFEKLKKSTEFKIVLDYVSGNSLFLIKRSIHRKNLATEILKILDTKITSETVLSVKEPYIKTMEKDSIDIANEIENLKNTK